VCRAFDVELLHIAEHFSIPVSEIAVNWHEIPGTYLPFLLACFLLNLVNLKTTEFKMVLGM